MKDFFDFFAKLIPTVVVIIIIIIIIIINRKILKEFLEKTYNNLFISTLNNILAMIISVALIIYYIIAAILFWIIKFEGSEVGFYICIMSTITVIAFTLFLARNKLLEDVIDNEEYLEIKTDCKDKIEKLESNLTKVKDKNKIDFPKLLDHALSNVVDLAKVYTKGIFR